MSWLHSRIVVMSGLNSSRNRMLISALLGLIIWGSWGYYANSNSDAPILAGVVQGCISFVVTISFTASVEALNRRLPARRKKWAPFLPFFVTTPSIVGVHLLVGTANIVLTILPPFFVSIIYMSLYGKAMATPSLTDQSIKN